MITFLLISWFVEIIFASIVIIIAFLVGIYYEYRKNRVQCVNCGNHNTYLAAAGWGGEGGEYKFAVKHHEQHVCKDCDKITIITMKLSK